MDTWTFSTAFELPPPEEWGLPNTIAAGGGDVGGDVGVGVDGCGWDLVLEGVDTVADVLLNGRVLAQVKNFHRYGRGRYGRGRYGRGRSYMLSRTVAPDMHPGAAARCTFFPCDARTADLRAPVSLRSGAL